MASHLSFTAAPRSCFFDEEQAVNALHSVKDLPSDEWLELLNKKVTWSCALSTVAKTIKAIDTIVSKITLELDRQNKNPFSDNLLKAEQYKTDLDTLDETFQKEKTAYETTTRELETAHRALDAQVATTLSRLSDKKVAEAFRKARDKWHSAHFSTDGQQMRQESKYSSTAFSVSSKQIDLSRAIEAMSEQAEAHKKKLQEADAESIKKRKCTSSDDKPSGGTTSSSSSSSPRVSTAPSSDDTTKRASLETQAEAENIKKRKLSSRHDESRGGATSSSSSSSLRASTAPVPPSKTTDPKPTLTTPPSDEEAEGVDKEAVARCRRELEELQKEEEQNQAEDCNGILTDIFKRQSDKVRELYDLEHPKEVAERKKRENEARLANLSKYYVVERIGGVLKSRLAKPGEATTDLRTVPSEMATLIRERDNNIAQKNNIQAQLESAKKRLAELRGNSST